MQSSNLVYRERLNSSIDNIQNSDSLQLLNSFEKENPCSQIQINRISKTCYSDGNIIKTGDERGVKGKTVNKVKSWNSRDKKGMQNNHHVINIVNL